MLRMLLLYVVIVAVLFSCKPRIYSFTASPLNVTAKDSVRFNWKISGEPTLLFNQRKIPFPPGDSLHVLEFTLVATKGEKEAYKKIQVTLLPQQSEDRVVIPVTNLKGDTVIATIIKDTIAWANFSIVSISSSINRKLWVEHTGLRAILADSSTSSNAFAGAAYKGSWQLRTLLTEAEKRDHSIIPERFVIKAVIQPKN